MPSPTRLTILVVASLALLTPTLAQMPQAAPVQLTAAQDHQRLLDPFHITALRPGVSQNPKSPNPVNYDESKANPWPNLPNPLVPIEFGLPQANHFRQDLVDQAATPTRQAL